MKIVLTLILLAMVSVSHAEEAETCPYGHDSVQEVPIMYGLPNFTRELKRKIKKHEVVLGGCVVSSNSPKHETMCTECGFRLEKGIWKISNSKKKKIKKPFPESFEKVQLKSPTYGHVFLSDGSDYLLMFDYLEGTVKEIKTVISDAIGQEPISVDDPSYGKLLVWMDPREPVDYALTTDQNFHILFIHERGYKTYANQAVDTTPISAPR